MAKPSAIAAKEPQIEISKPVLLSGVPFATFIPALALKFGSDIYSITYYQLHYLSREDSGYSPEQELNGALMVVPDGQIELTQVGTDVAYGNEKKSDVAADEGSHLESFTAEWAAVNAAVKAKYVGYDWPKIKRISLSRLQAQLPFVSKRWIIRALKFLEESGYLEVVRTKKVNSYRPLFHPDRVVAYGPSCEAYNRKYIVLPQLAQIIGLKEAIVLQQIHLRLHEHDGSHFVIRSLSDWHSKTFPYWSLPTVKRVFKKLRELSLLIVRPYRREDDGSVHSYRVNYIGLAEMLGLPIPQVENPFPHKPDNFWDNMNWAGWTNPVTLKMQKDAQ